MIRFVLLVTLCWLTLLDCAQARPNEEIFSDVRQLVGRGMRPLSQIVPGYRRSRNEAPSLTVGYLSDNAYLGLPWGKAVGAVLRSRMTASPRVRLRMPSLFHFRVDASSPEIKEKDIAVSKKSLILMANRLDLEHLLNGHFELDRKRFKLQLNLFREPFKEVRKTFSYQGKHEELSKVLDTAVSEIHLELGVKTGVATRENTAEPRFNDFQTYAKLLAAYEDKEVAYEQERALTEAAWQKISLFPELLPPWLYFGKHLEDMEEYNDRVAEALRRYRGNFAAELWAAYRMRTRKNNKDPHRRTKYYLLSRYIANNPQDPNGFLLLASEYSGPRELGMSIALTLEALERWPGNYRLWWNLAWALCERGWRYYDWTEAPRKTRARYLPHLQLAREAVDRAIELRPDLADLFVLRMRTSSVFSSEILLDFKKAIELKPDYKMAYEQALWRADSRWGGTKPAREEILRLAQENNPSQIWAQWLFQRFKE